ncbi:MAG TPA: hypothetical protein VFR56_11395 [Actinomycetes bacterium]|nr:hypothetical protein [Actinomycetes bacterium]
MSRLPSRAVVRDVVDRVTLVVTVAAGVAVAAVPDLRRPVLTAGGAAVALAVAAAVTRLRALGTLAVALTTLSVLLAAALDASDLRPVQVVAAGVLLLATLAALERTESPLGRRLGAATPLVVLRGPTASRLGVAAAALGASALVAATAAQTVVPSVGLVLGGLVAAVAALVVTTRAHRDEPAHDGPDVHESLSGRAPTARQR